MPKLNAATLPLAWPCSPSALPKRFCKPSVEAATAALGIEMSQSSSPATVSSSSAAASVRASTTASSLLATVSAEKPST
eukprot:2468425-Lingulodinium_polyedra.AAC.1